MAKLAKLEDIVSLCKRRGFIFQSSEIYGGLASCYDYGPLGSELKRNVRNAWWKSTVQMRDNVVGVDCSILMHPMVWKASGHVDKFADLITECKKCHARTRVDHLLNTQGKSAEELGTDINDTSDKVCPKCTKVGDFTEPMPFKLMFETQMGANADDTMTVFMRPETAQGIFANFRNVLDSARVKVPFGIAQIGKSFRNEITPRNYIFRSREFEQMEIEFFCHPSESNQWYEYWRNQRFQWYVDLGLRSERLRLREHGEEERSHYSCGTADVEYAFPFLSSDEYGELEGIAHRGDYDLNAHMHGQKNPDGSMRHKGSGKDLTYFDQQNNERYVPHVIEPSAGADRATLAFICEAYTQDESRPSPELMKFHPRLAPIKAAVFPLVAKDGMPDIAEPIYQAVRQRWPAQYDVKQSIGKRYARMDEAGTPFCFTIDGQTKEDGTVTVRDRDTGSQERIDKSRVVEFLEDKLNGSCCDQGKE
jgi:glycyl-tRNA synthetase